MTILRIPIVDFLKWHHVFALPFRHNSQIHEICQIAISFQETPHTLSASNQADTPLMVELKSLTRGSIIAVTVVSLQEAYLQLSTNVLIESTLDLVANKRFA